MTDIVERLRGGENSLHSGHPSPLDREAADEIERLAVMLGQRAGEIERLRALIDTNQRAATHHDHFRIKEIERLREAKAKAEGYMDQFAAEANEARTQALEEAARVAERFYTHGQFKSHQIEQIAASIRALIKPSSAK